MPEVSGESSVSDTTSVQSVDEHPIWRRVLDELSLVLTPENFTTWLEGTRSPVRTAMSCESPSRSRSIRTGWITSCVAALRALCADLDMTTYKSSSWLPRNDSAGMSRLPAYLRRPCVCGGADPTTASSRLTRRHARSSAQDQSLVAPASRRRSANERSWGDAPTIRAMIVSRSIAGVGRSGAMMSVSGTVSIAGCAPLPNFGNALLGSCPCSATGLRDGTCRSRGASCSADWGLSRGAEASVPEAG